LVVEGSGVEQAGYVLAKSALDDSPAEVPHEKKI
jgi:hypothetical protein